MRTDQNDSMAQRKNTEEVIAEGDFDLFAELDKPVEEMRVDLISSSLSLTEEEKEELHEKRRLMMENILEKTDGKPGKTFRFSKPLTIAASILLIFATTMATARGFFWEQFLAFFSPVRELFAASTLSQDDPSTASLLGKSEEEGFYLPEHTSQEFVYWSEDSFLGVLAPRYRWAALLTKSFSFIKGTVSSDDLRESIHMDLTDEQDSSIFVHADHYLSEDYISDTLLEINEDSVTSESINGITVYFAMNLDSRCAYWAHEQNLYTVTGTTDHEAILTIVHIITEEM